MRIQAGDIVKIQNLRKRGYSIPEISRECSISKSTVLRYAKKVEILPKYYERWIDRHNAGKIVAQRRWDAAVKESKVLIDGIDKKDWILIAASLYWAEGAKRDFSFSNTDPKMVRVFTSILKNIFGVKNEDFKISLRLYEDLDEKRCIKHWSDILGFSLRGRVSINILKGSKIGKLQFGMCRVRVRKGGFLLKKFSAITDRINDYLPL
jgi:hypothetical protein